MVAQKGAGQGLSSGRREEEQGSLEVTIGFIRHSQRASRWGRGRIDGLGDGRERSTTEQRRTEDAEREVVRRMAKAWLAGRLACWSTAGLVLMLVVHRRAGELREEDRKCVLGDRQVLIYRLKGMSRWRLWSLWWRASVIVEQGPSSLDQEPVFKRKLGDEV